MDSGDDTEKKGTQKKKLSYMNKESEKKKTIDIPI